MFFFLFLSRAAFGMQTEGMNHMVVCIWLKSWCIAPQKRKINNDINSTNKCEEKKAATACTTKNNSTVTFHHTYYL